MTTKPLLQEMLKGLLQEEERTEGENHKRKEKMAISKYLSIITLNVNRLSVSIKRHKVAERILKMTHVLCLVLWTRDSPQNNRLIQAASEGMKRKHFHVNGYNKKSGVAVLKCDKIEFKSKAVTGDKEGHCIILKGSFQEENITL